MGKSIKCMKDLDLFQALDNIEKQKVIKLAMGKSYSKGEMIFNEGDPADTIYLIRAGKVLLFKCSEEGKEISLDILEENDIIGENTIFDNMQQTFSAKALENTYICSCLKSDFPQLLKNPDISMKIIKSLTDKLNNYTDSMANIAFCDVKNRVLNALNRIGKKYGTVTSKGIQLEIQLSHEDIAHLVNASRVMVTNTIKALKEEGRISIFQKKYLIHSKSAADSKSWKIKKQSAL